jgi:hypothetical protein
MSCKRARSQIRQLLRDRVNPLDDSELRQHLVSCANCRSVWRRSHSGAQALAHYAAEADEPPNLRLWPRLRRIIAQRERFLLLDRFNGWKWSFVVATSWVVLFAIVFRQQSTGEDSFRSALGESPPATVSHSPAPTQSGAWDLLTPFSMFSPARTSQSYRQRGRQSFAQDRMGIIGQRESGECCPHCGRNCEHVAGRAR